MSDSEQQEQTDEDKTENNQLESSSARDATACASRGGAPYCCPVCNGAGHISRPPHVAGDASSWTDSGSRTYRCGACGGRGIVWSSAQAVCIKCLGKGCIACNGFGVVRTEREARTYGTMEAWRKAYATWKALRPVYAPPDCEVCGKMQMAPSAMPAFKRVDLSEFCMCDRVEVDLGGDR